jgi:hypothetical protein
VLYLIPAGYIVPLRHTNATRNLSGCALKDYSMSPEGYNHTSVDATGRKAVLPVYRASSIVEGSL